jgi:hypothetical protein
MKFGCFGFVEFGRAAMGRLERRLFIRESIDPALSNQSAGHLDRAYRRTGKRRGGEPDCATRHTWDGIPPLTIRPESGTSAEFGLRSAWSGLHYGLFVLPESHSDRLQPWVKVRNMSLKDQNFRIIDPCRVLAETGQKCASR